MPIYLYQHPKTKKIKEVVQTMSEEHVYSEKGVQWNRIFTVPQAGVDTAIDPFSERQFMDKVGAKNGKMGEAWDRSQELSHKRAQKAGGVDPIKEKYLNAYEKKRKGKPHPERIKEQANKTFTI